MSDVIKRIALIGAFSFLFFALFQQFALYYAFSGMASTGDVFLEIISPVSLFPVLTVTVTDTPDPVTNGSFLTYTVLVNNTGTATASNATLKNFFSENVSFFSATPLPNVSNSTWFLGDIPVGSAKVVTIIVIVKPTATAGSIITNLANVSYINGTANFSAAVETNTSVILSAPPTPAPSPPPPGGGDKTECKDICVEATRRCSGPFAEECVRNLLTKCTIWRTVDECDPIKKSCVRGTCICREDWSCSSWDMCKVGKRNRFCTDKNECGTNYLKPPLTMPCGPTCTDGEKNQGELGVDCGGPCPPCLIKPSIRVARGGPGYIFLVLKQLFLCFWIPLFLIFLIIICCILFSKEEEDDMFSEVRDFFG